MISLKYDLHIHSCLSPCGSEDMTPNNIAGMAMLSGIQLAALTDHNSAKNCPAFFKACRNVGVIPIAGMELTTQEEVHVVCLFPDLESALRFDEFVDSHRMKIKNKPHIFGEQIIMNENDEIIGNEEYLLIAATDLDIAGAAKYAREFGGVAFPAHIDKQTNSVLAVLGIFPDYVGFTAVEIRDIDAKEKVIRDNPSIKDLIIVNDSDSHMLDSFALEAPVIHLDCDHLDEKSVSCALIAHLRGDTK